MTSTPGLPPLTAVVVAHDPGEAIHRVLGAIASLPGAVRTLVMDSGTSDGSLEGLEQRWPHVELVPMGSNCGPSVARNRGLQMAQTSWVLCSDDDMHFDQECVLLLGEALRQRPQAAMVGPAICRSDRPDEVLYAGGRAHFSGQPHMLGHGSQHADGMALPPRRVEVLTSGLLLVRKDTVLAAGGFDEDFFFLMEDVELALRLTLLGHLLFVVPRAKAWNGGGSGELSLQDSGHSRARFRLQARNRTWALLGLARPTTLLLLAWPLLLLELAWFALALQAGAAGAYASGKLEGLARVGVWWRARRRVAGRRVAPDGVLFAAPHLTFTAAATGRGLFALAAGILDGTLRLMHLPFAKALR